MRTTVLIVFVVMGLAYSSASILIRNTCPPVRMLFQLPAHCASETDSCSHSTECEAGKLCCITGDCGKSSCISIGDSCSQNGENFVHGSMMPYADEDQENNRCGLCYCDDGRTFCHPHNCHGDVAMP